MLSLNPSLTLGPSLLSGIGGAIVTPAESAFAYNLGFARHYSSNRPFLNLIKLAKYWAADNSASFTRDADFYPTEIPAGASHLFSDLFVDDSETGLLGQTIHIYWDGDATVELGDGGTVTTNEANHIAYTPTTGLHRYEITDLGATGISNMRVLRDDHVALYNSGEVYNQQWLNIVSKAKSLRFLNWLTINGNNNDELWADRPVESRYSYLFRIPYEIVIDICNRAGADLWYQAPNRVGQDFAEGIAALVRDTLDTSLTCYVELSNETWNNSFDQALYYIAKGVEDWGTAGTGTVSFVASDTAITGTGTAFTTELSPAPVLVAADGQLIEVNTITDDTNYVSSRSTRRDATDVPFAYDNVYQGTSSYVKYATQFAKWWQAIHPTRCKHLLGGQASSTSNVPDLIAAADWQTHEPGNWEARNVTFDGIAVATYFSSNLTDSAIIAELNTASATSDAAMLAVLDGYMRAGHVTSLAGLTGKLRDHHRDCRDAGLELYAYEGGSHIVHPVTNLTTQELDDLFDHFQTWVNSDTATTFLQDHLLAHKAFVDGPYMQFDAVSAWDNTVAWGTYQTPDYEGDKRSEFIESLENAGRFWGDDIAPQSLKVLPDINGTELVDIGTIRLDVCFTANATAFSSPDLPAGLTLDASTGDITGIPDPGEAGSGDYTIVASNGAGSIQATGSYTLAAHVPIDVLAITDARVYDLTDAANLSPTTGPASFGIAVDAEITEIANIGDASGFNMVYDQGTKPTFSGDGADFSAAAAFISSQVPITGEDRSIFMAARVTNSNVIAYGGTSGSGQRTFVGYSGAAASVEGAASGAFGDDSINGLNDDTDIRNTNSVIGIIHDGDTTRIFLNGVEQASFPASGTSGTLAHNCLGTFIGATGVTNLGFGFEGEMFAIVDAPKVLNSSEIYDVSTWLSGKMPSEVPTVTSMETSVTDAKTGHVYSFVAADGVTPEAREVGQYANGNWFVVGGSGNAVRIGSITPVSTSISTSAYTEPDNVDDTATVGAQTRWMHGTMVNPWDGVITPASANTGFDNYYGSAQSGSSVSYLHSKNDDPGATGSPLELTEGSVVKSESFPTEGGHLATALDKTRMLKMSCLTVVNEVPAANSLRPGPRAPSKASEWTLSNIDARMTATRQIISGFRPFTTTEIDTATSRIAFLQQTFAPFQEQARRINPGARGGGVDIYGDEWYDIFKLFFACYHGDYTNAELVEITKAVIQVGIDIYGLLQDDSYYFGWQAHHAGRKGIVFAAGHILGNQDILDQCDYNLHPEHFGVDDAICGYVNADMIGPQPRWYRKAFPHKWEDTHLGLAEWSNVFCPGTAPTASDVETTDQVVDAGILERDYNVLSVDNGAMYQALWGMICDPTAQYYNPAYFDFTDRYLAHRFGDQIHGDFDISGDETSTNGVTIGNWWSINPTDATVVNFQTMRNSCSRTNYVLSMVPEALQIPTVTHDGSSGHLVVDLNWNNVLVPRTEDVAVIRYDIRWKAYVGGADIAASESADNYFGSYEWQYIEGVTFPYNLSEVPRNEKVQVQVRAVNANGEGHWLSDEKRENYADTSSQPPFVALSGYRRYARNFDVPDIAAFDKAPINFKIPALDKTSYPTGTVATATEGQWSASPAVSATDYKWQVSDDGATGWSDISGATSSTFTTTSSEEGKFIRVGVRKTNSAGTAAYVYSDVLTSVVVPIFTELGGGFASGGVFDTGVALGGKRLLVLYSAFNASPVTYGGDIGAHSFTESDAIYKDNTGTTSGQRWRHIAYIVDVPGGETATEVEVVNTAFPEVIVYELDEEMTLLDSDKNLSGLTLSATSETGGGAFWWAHAATSTSFSSSPTIVESPTSVTYDKANRLWGHDLATPDTGVAITHVDDPASNMRATLITLEPAA